MLMESKKVRSGQKHIIKINLITDFTLKHKLKYKEMKTLKKLRLTK
jgi:hypothetical protein